MVDESENGSLWAQLRSNELQPVARIGMSIASGVLLSAVALVGVWLWGQATGQRRVRDEEVAVAFCLASAIWVWALFGIWGRVYRTDVLARPSSMTCGIAVLTSLVCLAIEELVHNEEEYLMVAAACLGSAAVVVVWLPALGRLVHGKRVVGSDDEVDVRCPGCGYRLVGLRELRCPECGARFTIDELIRAQHYSGVSGTRAKDRRREGDRSIPRVVSGGGGDD